MGDSNLNEYESISLHMKYFGLHNVWAHEGTKEKRLNKEEVGFLKLINSHFH